MTPPPDVTELPDANADADANVDGERDGARRHRALVLAGRIVLLLVTIGGWEALARLELIPAAFIGQPSVFLPMMVEELLGGSILHAIADTLSATLAAFVLGGVLALITALVLHAWPLLKAVVDPYLNAMNALPRVALVPLFIIWFGLGALSKIVSGISLMYFILLYNTIAGAQSVDPDHVLLARSLGLTQRHIFLHIVVPTAAPAIFAGLRLGLVYTLLGVVTAELIAGGKGLGSLISYYSNTFNANGVFAVLLVLVILADLLSGLMTRTEHYLTRWKG
jgi:NitT/TauT family transport system permease protein